MPTFRAGRHELGQNYLAHAPTIRRFVDLVDETRGPIVEIGGGRGALTRELAKLSRPLQVIELDPANAATLRRDLPKIDVVEGDFLQWRLPGEPHVLVGNVPFHLTTAMLRKILHAPDWTDAVLLLQWEVARRRAGVGGASMMTAQWWPWIDFRLDSRVPRSAFRPQPNVDGGLLAMTRRPEPLVANADRNAYRQFVHSVFTGRGRGLAGIVERVAAAPAAGGIRRWFAEQRVRRDALPKDLSATQWASLFEAVRAAPRRRQGRGRRGPRRGSAHRQRNR